MTQKDKDLLLKDLCARLPYGLKCEINDNVEILDSICDDDGYYFNFIGDDKEGYTLDEVKPYLFPMSSMTEKQCEELIKLINTGQNDNNEFMRSLCRIEFYHVNHLDYRGLIPKGLAKDATKIKIY